MLPIATYKIYRNTSIAILALVIAVASWFIIFPDTQANTSDQVFVAKLVELTNDERARHDLNELTVDDKLSEAAYDKAVDLVKNDYFAHTSPSGKTPWYWMDEVDYKYIYAGENLAINYTTPEATQEAWMNSESHKENILSPNFDEVGIAEAQGVINGQEATVIVVMFGREVQY